MQKKYTTGNEMNSNESITEQEEYIILYIYIIYIYIMPMGIEFSSV